MEMSQGGSMKMVSLITLSCAGIWLILHGLWMWLPLR
ncbi:hypothetical protein FBBNIHIM_10265 [Pseudocitrobacter vendiensis]|uniref:Uncharacterized protein n=1 Tax=Pseudocitrobacter vendiensis TaxID=2488306 RepID=A0ABM9F8M5_9ENTR|nr:hypothetical protein FBBNIHIM_10265 [Pseudocitrobacter vendiensis]